ncbi:BTAD domain-containing putative transcriptional regulator [Nocardioides sediminis]|uniref:BTAD domain-containing putative transcriptional regulator n=1 Tax=Nocardioides sediminis TaxID=433648 RepID=UPI000D304968|nr:BTAD domain-containing putative transcriptional regulator [Nocardioides sediminis]
MIQVLGPLQVLRDGAPVEIGSPRHREVLAALVVDVGRVVSTEALLERVWGDVGRGASTSNLHAVISRLRARLRVEDGAIGIATASPGYRLDAPGAVDALAFQEHVAAARRRVAAGDPAGARAALEAGLALWRGPAYADVPLPFAEVEAARLDGLRLAALELVVEAELALGLHADALDRLPALVADHPLHEAFRGQLMLALYRAGRQAEALDVYAEVRERLSEELGIDPGPELRDLQVRILAQDQDLLAPEAGAAPGGVPVSADPVAGSADAGPDASWHSEVVVPADRLVGREHAVDYLRDLLATSAQRLVTITGVGGVGKTRLAHAVARACRPDFPDGVAVVSLAPLADPELVLPAVGRAVGLSAVEGLDPVGVVAQHLRDRRTLVVLDNAEHLLDSAAGIARLVALCPRLSVVVTSRTTLRVRGELQYQLTPLAVPGDGEDPGLVAEAPAVALFVDRARAVQPGFGLDADNAAAVAGICRRLAGIPLAIELAAARSHLMSPAAVWEHLDRVMAGSGARDLPPRQRTMRAAIDWSYQLLEPEQQALFRRLAVFSDGFTLDAVEAVAGGAPGPTGDADVLALLEELVAHSLVLRDPDHPGVVRFRLLEPVAQFAADLLADDEEQAVRDAHLHHFLRLAEDTEPGYRGTRTTEALTVTQREHANLVAALEWALASGRGDLAGRMTWAMWLFWWLRGHLLEGRRLVQAVLAQELPDPVRVRAHAVMGAMTFAQGDTVLARHWCRGVVLARRIGDLEGEAHNLAGEGLVALAEDHLDEAEVRFVETVRLTEEAGLAGEWLWTLAHVWQATVRLLLGFPGHAVPLLERALEAARRRDDPLAIYIALFTSVQVRLVDGDLVTARAQLAEGVRLSVDTGDMANLAYFLEALAVVEAREQHAHRVALLHGAARRLRDTVGANVYGYYQPDEQALADALAASRDVLGASYDDVVAQGRALTVEETVALATDPATD